MTNKKSERQKQQKKQDNTFSFHNVSSSFLDCFLVEFLQRILLYFHFCPYFFFYDENQDVVSRLTRVGVTVVVVVDLALLTIDGRWLSA